LYGALIHDVDVQLSRAVHGCELRLAAELDASRDGIGSRVDRRHQFRVPMHHEDAPAGGIVNHAIRILRRGNLLADAQRCEIEHDDRMRLRTPGIPFVQRRYQGNAIRSRNGNLADYGQPIRIHDRHGRFMGREHPVRLRVPRQVIPTVGRTEQHALGRAVERLGCGWRGGGWCDGRCIRIGRGGRGERQPQRQEAAPEGGAKASWLDVHFGDSAFIGDS